jgi:hypothetical protein
MKFFGGLKNERGREKYPELIQASKDFMCPDIKLAFDSRRTNGRKRAGIL